MPRPCVHCGVMVDQPPIPPEGGEPIGATDAHGIAYDLPDAPVREELRFICSLCDNPFPHGVRIYQRNGAWVHVACGLPRMYRRDEQVHFAWPDAGGPIPEKYAPAKKMRRVDILFPGGEIPRRGGIPHG